MYLSKNLPNARSYALMTVRSEMRKTVAVSATPLPFARLEFSLFVFCLSLAKTNVLNSR
jgi:hypothetical protein